jgi:hypothetical protein
LRRRGEIFVETIDARDVNVDFFDGSAARGSSPDSSAA